MIPEDSQNEHRQHSIVSALLHLLEFWETTERLLSVLAGLFLAVGFCLMPFSSLGQDDPWYFWVGSGAIALAVSILLSWAFFPSTKGKKAGLKDDAANRETPDGKSVPVVRN